MFHLSVCVLAIALVFSGCGKKEDAQVQGNTYGQERQEMAQKLILKSLSDLQNKDLKSAVASLEASIQVNPTVPDAYLLLGQILLKVQEFPRAEQFLDEAAKTFPDNGTIFYMLSVASRMNGKKLPAVLASRRAVEIFQQAQDKDNMLKSAVLLQDLINTPDDKFIPGAPDGDMKNNITR